MHQNTSKKSKTRKRKNIEPQQHPTNLQNRRRYRNQKSQDSDHLQQQIEDDQQQQLKQHKLDNQQLEAINYQLQKEYEEEYRKQQKYNQNFSKYEASKNTSLSRHYIADTPKINESSEATNSVSPPDSKPVVSPESIAGSKTESVYEKTAAANALLEIRRNSKVSNTSFLKSNYLKTNNLDQTDDADEREDLLTSINKLSSDLLKVKTLNVKPPLEWGGRVGKNSDTVGEIPASMQLQSICNVKFYPRFPALESHKSVASKAGSTNDDESNNAEDFKLATMPRLTLPASKKSPTQKSPAVIHTVVNNLNSGNFMKSFNDDIIPPNMYDIVEVNGKKKRVFNAMKRELDKKFEKGTVKRLRRYMRQAYQDGTVCSPKWKNFSGLKIRMFDKQRLNNAIWRTWFHVHSNYGGKMNEDSIFVTAPDVNENVDLMKAGPSTKLLENTIVSGQYWRRQVHVQILYSCEYQRKCCKKSKFI